MEDYGWIDDADAAGVHVAGDVLMRALMQVGTLEENRTVVNRTSALIAAQVIEIKELDTAFHPPRSCNLICPDESSCADRVEESRIRALERSKERMEVLMKEPLPSVMDRHVSSETAVKAMSRAQQVAAEKVSRDILLSIRSSKSNVSRTSSKWGTIKSKLHASHEPLPTSEARPSGLTSTPAIPLSDQKTTSTSHLTSKAHRATISAPMDRSPPSNSLEVESLAHVLCASTPRALSTDEVQRNLALLQEEPSNESQGPKEELVQAWTSSRPSVSMPSTSIRRQTLDATSSNAQPACDLWIVPRRPDHGKSRKSSQQRPAATIATGIFDRAPQFDIGNVVEEEQGKESALESDMNTTEVTTRRRRSTKTLKLQPLAEGWEDKEDVAASERSDTLPELEAASKQRRKPTKVPARRATHAASIPSVCPPRNLSRVDRKLPLVSPVIISPQSSPLPANRTSRVSLSMESNSDGRRYSSRNSKLAQRLLHKKLSTRDVS